MEIQEVFTQLRKPFPPEDIEWRLSRSGKNGTKVWAQCLAYVDARAVQDRLDSVVGPENWQDRYTPLEEGFICELSLYVGDRWITKADGAQKTDFEGFKGGLSGALKRAASKWGIGRYLYGIPESFANVVEKGTQGAMWGRTKEKADFYWLPPNLPAWALPDKEGSPSPKTKEPEAKPNVRTEKMKLFGVMVESMGCKTKKAKMDKAEQLMGVAIHKLTDGQLDELLQKTEKHVQAYHQGGSSVSKGG